MRKSFGFFKIHKSRINVCLKQVDSFCVTIKNIFIIFYHLKHPLVVILNLVFFVSTFIGVDVHRATALHPQRS